MDKVDAATELNHSADDGAPSKSHGKVRVVAAIIAVVCLVAVSLGVSVVRANHASPKASQSASSTPKDNGTSSPSEEEASPSPTEEPKPYVEDGPQGYSTYTNQGEINVLLLGSDSRITKGNVNAWYAGDARSDSLMLVQISPNRQHITVMSFPRNTAAVIPGYGDKTLVNIAYERGGVPLAVQTIQELTGVRIDYWVLTDFQAFMAMVDAIGGINLDSVQEGSRWYNGWDALKWVRQRKALPNGDIDRVRRHQAFMRALHAKMLTPDALASVGGVQGLYNILRSYVATNMDVGVAVNIASTAASVGSGNIVYLTFPYADTVQDASGYYMLNPNWSQAAPLVYAFKQGQAWEYVQSHSLETLDSRAIE